MVQIVGLFFRIPLDIKKKQNKKHENHPLPIVPFYFIYRLHQSSL